MSYKKFIMKEYIPISNYSIQNYYKLFRIITSQKGYFQRLKSKFNLLI